MKAFLFLAPLIFVQFALAEAQTPLPSVSDSPTEVKSINLDADSQTRRAITPHSILSGLVTSARPYRIELNGGDRVVLHRGTVIKPNGTRLQPGLQVRIFGRRDLEGSFHANLIEVFNGESMR